MLAPSQIVAHTDVRQANVGAHMVFVGVPLVNQHRPLVIFTEGHNHADGEAPFLPIVGKVDQRDALGPGDDLSVDGLLGANVLARESESVVSCHDSHVSAPVVMIVQIVGCLL